MSARIYLWLAHMAAHEADRIAYAYPQPEVWADQYGEWMDAADRCAERGFRGVDQSQRDAVWRDAMDAWEVAR